MNFDVISQVESEGGAGGGRGRMCAIYFAGWGDTSVRHVAL